METRKRSRSISGAVSTVFDEPPMKLQRKTEKKKDSHEDDSEEDEEVGEEIEKFLNKLKTENFFTLFRKKEKVYRRDNHIYFNCGVSNDSINSLAKLIHEVEEEFEELKNELQQKNKLVSFEKLEPKPIYLHITSFGGSLFAGFRGVDIIKNSKIPVYTVVEGYAMSAASQMAVAGKKRYMTENSYILIHQLRSYNESGTFEELKDNFTNNKSLMKRIIDIYYEHTHKKITKKQIETALRRDLYWSYDYCQKHGFVDGLYTGKN